MAVEVEFFRCQPQRQANQLRQMQDRNVKLLPQIALNLPLKSVEHCVASGQGVTIACAPPVFAARMCWPVSLIATFSSCAAVWKPQHSVRPL